MLPLERGLPACLRLLRRAGRPGSRGRRAIPRVTRHGLHTKRRTGGALAEAIAVPALRAVARLGGDGAADAERPGRHRGAARRGNRGRGRRCGGGHRTVGPPHRRGRAARSRGASGRRRRRALAVRRAAALRRAHAPGVPASRVPQHGGRPRSNTLLPARPAKAAPAPPPAPPHLSPPPRRQRRSWRTATHPSSTSRSSNATS